MNYLPFIVFAVIVVGLLFFAGRARRRQAMADDQRREAIRVGSEVMTTSGLYGTVVAMNGDDTVQLSVAPGLELKWAFAALRDVETLPDRYRQGAADDTEGDETRDPGADVPAERRADPGNETGA